ncbi:hypothetical protein Q5752_005802 [Cryptotrichosporon argae]
MSAQADQPRDTEREVPSLPAVDKSRQAWAYALGAFIVEMLMWGPLASTGVFFKYYATLPAFRDAPETRVAHWHARPVLLLRRRHPRDNASRPLNSRVV